MICRNLTRDGLRQYALALASSLRMQMADSRTANPADIARMALQSGDSTVHLTRIAEQLELSMAFWDDGLTVDRATTMKSRLKMMVHMLNTGLVRAYYGTFLKWEITSAQLSKCFRSSAGQSAADIKRVAFRSFRAVFAEARTVLGMLDVLRTEPAGEFPTEEFFAAEVTQAAAEEAVAAAEQAAPPTGMYI